MSNLNNWHDEWMNELKQREIRKELEHIRLLKEAGIGGSNWLADTGKAIGNLLAALSRKRQSHRPVKHISHRPLHGKYIR